MNIRIHEINYKYGRKWIGMKKYVSFFRLRFLDGLQYRATAVAGVITQFVWGGMEILMFRAFYQADSNAFPMEFSSLSNYIWMQQAFLCLFMAWLLENEIFESIQNGSIAYELCRPIDIYNMWFVRSIAVRLSKAILRCVPVFLVAGCLPKPYGLGLPYDVKSAFWFMISMIVAFLLVVAFCMLIYIVSFFTISSNGIRMLALSAIEFFSGATIPLPFLPKGIREIFELLPFGSMQNVPFLIYSKELNNNALYRAVLLQVIWLILFVIIGKQLMKKAIKKVILQGG